MLKKSTLQEVIVLVQVERGKDLLSSSILLTLESTKFTEEKDKNQKSNIS